MDDKQRSHVLKPGRISDAQFLEWIATYLVELYGWPTVSEAIQRLHSLSQSLQSPLVHRSHNAVVVGNGKHAPAPAPGEPHHAADQERKEN